MYFKRGRGSESEKRMLGDRDKISNHKSDSTISQLHHNARKAKSKRGDIRFK